MTSPSNDSIRTAVSTDELYSTLATEECRLVLDYFEESKRQTAEVADLADYLARQAPFERDAARVLLHHLALPKLEAIDVLEYDPATRTIEFEGHQRLVRDATGWDVVSGHAEEIA